MTKLTEKELTFITELIGFEQNAMAKANYYSKSCNCAEVSVVMDEIAKKHALRIEKLTQKLN